MLMVEEFFGHLGEIHSVPGRQISTADVADADLLLVRSVTKVNRDLLEGSSVSFVGSATIGTDHVDLAYLEEQGIRFAHAPGCNANAVVQYVLSVLGNLQPDWLSREVGIVGCGNVGGRLYNCLQSLGVSCRVYDPFLTEADNPHLVDFQSLLGADIICLHTPLTSDGPHPTKHLFDAETLASISEETLLINAGRGPVIDNAALCQLLEQGSGLSVVLDVWEPEPDINCRLLQQVVLATPHIAGYSREGKIRGTQMLAEDFNHWRQGDGFNQELPETAIEQGSINQVSGESLSELILAAYNVADDDRRMRSAIENALAEEGVSVAETFDRLRREYPQRHEFPCFRTEVSGALKAQARLLGFC